MKIIITMLMMLFSFAVVAQHFSFIRIYNKAGRKINKGTIVSVTDSSIALKRGSVILNIPATDIGYIKTKHSTGNNILVASSISAGVLAIFFAATAEPNKTPSFNAGEGFALGVLAGAPLGTVIGGITTLFKNSKTFIINGDATKWKEFQSAANKDKAL
ncbi:MAG: hypothetical protein K2X26_14715 [Chitinophagaceae bacterium]|nr:hypothetical protein [Chitinophagaceae bacterium]